MERTLLLAFERAGHPQAVAHAATEGDAGLVLELLAYSYPARLNLAVQLRNYLKQQRRLPPPLRQRVPVRRPNGLYHSVAWRLAKWLANVLPAEEAVIERTASRIRAWLSGVSCQWSVVNCERGVN